MGKFWKKKNFFKRKTAQQAAGRLQEQWPGTGKAGIVFKIDKKKTTTTIKC